MTSLMDSIAYLRYSASNEVSDLLMDTESFMRFGDVMVSSQTKYRQRIATSNIRHQCQLHQQTKCAPSDRQCNRDRIDLTPDSFGFWWLRFSIRQNPR